LAAGIGREARQRTTTYGEPPAERVEAARAHRTTGYAATGRRLALTVAEVRDGA
jgi:FO synthase